MDHNTRKCSFGTDILIKPDGVNILDPCLYETIEKHTNVTVKILRCSRCGSQDIEWERTENTEDYYMEEAEDE